LHLADGLSKMTCIAFQGKHSFQLLLSLGIKPMTLALEVPTLFELQESPIEEENREQNFHDLGNASPEGMLYGFN